MENNCNCFSNTINIILELQKKGQCFDKNLPTCDRPYLGCGNNNCTYNTRPITLYSCGNSNLWSMPYTLNAEEGTSTVFRCEAADGCCLTCRILAPNPDTTSTYPYAATDNFFTINLTCIGAIKCLDDTYVACL